MLEYVLGVSVIGTSMMDLLLAGLSALWPPFEPSNIAVFRLLSSIVFQDFLCNALFVVLLHVPYVGSFIAVESKKMRGRGENACVEE